ncbi:MAG TPA: hypothetical protein VF746_25120 [Longimicrobium sp.]|jgi:anti-sigma-K factor RskA
MNDADRELLLRAALGELDGGEEARLRERLRREPELAAALERARAAAALLASSRAEGFGAGFSSRVLARLRAEETAPAAALARALQRQFLRLAPVGLAALVALGVHNAVAGSREGARDPLEAALGLPAVTFEAAYSSGAALYEPEP